MSDNNIKRLVVMQDNIDTYIEDKVTSLLSGGGGLSLLGVTASVDELNYCKGVTSNIQTQLNNKANSTHTHSNYLTTSASCNKNWNWSGKSGQPAYVWGGNDGTNMYVYNPSNFKVNTATNWPTGSTAGIGDKLLANHALSRTTGFTVNELVHSGYVKFFTNWDDSANFPEIYGSGVFIPCLDGSMGFILYMAGGNIYMGNWNNTNGITWYWHEADKSGLK